MALVLDPIYIVNLTLCIIILLLGIFGYRKKDDPTPLYIGIAFGLFGVSHLATILDLKDALELFLIVIRTVAYLTVIFALYTLLKRRH
jgi:predicted membrane channel-forming protein YqfA (hemolysin III family)